MLTTETAQRILRDSGVRLTPQRMLIIAALVGNRAHPTIEAIFEQARAGYAGISLATVYHTVSLLARHGLVQELFGSKDGLRCDPNTSPHAHAYCSACGTVIDLPETTSTLASDIPLQGFTPQRVEISFYGICEVCAHP